MDLWSLISSLFKTHSKALPPPYSPQNPKYDYWALTHKDDFRLLLAQSPHGPVTVIFDTAEEAEEFTVIKGLGKQWFPKGVNPQGLEYPGLLMQKGDGDGP
jgi:hypothetical protein